MIFLSHTHKDKDIVDPIANRLADIFGQDNVFYDSWSIQPGDGIVDKINQGLDQLNILFFFISKDSLKSNMVKLEWQNALFKATNGNIKIIPIRIDNSDVPSILLQTLYLDIYTNGIEIVLRQMVDIINGNNIYKSSFKEFKNVEAEVKFIDECKLDLVIFAKKYMEPISRYGIVLLNEETDITVKVNSDIMYSHGFNKNAAIMNTPIGVVEANVFAINLGRSTTPGFPINISVVSDNPIIFLGVLRADAEDEYIDIPVKVIQNIL